jgi:eukaryotic-like serine/threonine-protein kinase
VRSTTLGQATAIASERWQRLARLLEQALAQPEESRRHFVEAQCQDDPDLAREVLSLVSAHAIADSPLDSFAAVLQPREGEADTEPPVAPRVGPYLLVGELGRGGMGIVYLARRADGQYTRTVALKVAQSPVLDPGVRDRFLAERDILARLSHRNIAQLFDGGVTVEGHPYFTMELVEGRPIDVHCDEESLDVAARIRLFLQVCDAVSAAHRNLVVHRDLKPNNILVNADGEVKLLDFGIAKLLDPLRPEHETRLATRLFTRDYASPEQVRGEPVTTASDVYSLGAVLYRLLTGGVAHRFQHDTPADIERVVCDVEPPTPRLGPDLDNIVLKALSKDPLRRYASVDLFAQDLDHYLRGRPVAARSDSAAYRAGKFVRRHRYAVAAAAMVLVVLAAGIVATVLQAQKARAAAARAQRVSMLLTDLFKLAEPGQLQGGTITARELLDVGTRRIAAELAGDPDAQATMYGVIGRLYRNLALNEPAGRALERALELRRQVSGTDSLAYAEALYNLADLQYERNDYAAAERTHRQALDLRRRLAAPPRDIAASLEGVGRVLSSSGKHVDADAPLSEALLLRRSYGGERGTEIIETMHELALARLRKGDQAGGEPLFREAVEIGRRLPAVSADLRVNGLVNLARLRHRFERKPAEAEVLYREALALARRWYPSGHPDVATCLSELAAALRDIGRLEEAEAVATESLGMWRQRYAPNHREVIVATQRLASILVERGNATEAERLLREALAASHTSMGDGHPLTLTAQADLASFLQKQGRMREAVAVSEAALDAARRKFGEKDVYVARAWASLGQLHATLGDSTRAEIELRHAVDLRRQLHARGHWRIAEAEAALGAVLHDAGRHDEAETLLAGAVAAFDQDGKHGREREAAAKQLTALRRRGR